MSPREPLRHVVRKPWTRRDLFKAAPLVALGVGAVGLGWWGRTPATETRTHGTCRFCLMRCGIECVVRDGRLVKVEGDLKARTRGFVCEHGYALRELVHSRDRVQHPLIRRGDAFHEVTWDEALAFIGERLQSVKQQYGARALALQSGWPFVRHPFVGFLHRFARAFGSPNVATVSSLCEASLRMGQALTVGTKYSPELRKVQTLVVWGANPPTSAPTFAHLVADKARTGALVVIDPVRTTLAKEATVYLQIRPGTDGALALGLIRRVLELRPPSEELQARLHGLSELRGLADGFTPERVERETSIPGAQLERVAQLLATTPALGIWQGLGVEHHTHGVQTVRAITSLEVLCGRFDAPDPRALVTPVGPHFHDEPLPALYRMRTPDPAPPAVHEPAIGRARFPLFDRYNREAQGELFPDAILDDAPYPLRALILWGSNPFITASDSARWEQAKDRLDLVVTVDPFFSASAQRSDVVLPACTFAESPDVDADDRDVAAKSLVPVQGEARPDFEILTALARTCGLERWFPWKSFAEAMHAPLVSWMEDSEQQPHPHPEAPADFGTPTGKAELISTVLEASGHPGLPDYQAPRTARSAEYPLWLVSGPRPRAGINSQFAASPSVRARMKEPELLMHPSAAARAGVEGQSHVAVVSPSGRIELRLVVTEDVHPEAVVLPSGWESANANRLTTGEHRDPISGFPAFRSGVCRVERQDLAEPASEPSRKPTATP